MEIKEKNEPSVLFVKEGLEGEKAIDIVQFIFIVPWQCAILLYRGILDGNLPIYTDLLWPSESLHNSVLIV